MKVDRDIAGLVRDGQVIGRDEQVDVDRPDDDDPALRAPRGHDPVMNSPPSTLMMSPLS